MFLISKRYGVGCSTGRSGDVVPEGLAGSQSPWSLSFFREALTHRVWSPLRARRQSCSVFALPQGPLHPRPQYPEHEPMSPPAALLGSLDPLSRLAASSLLTTLPAPGTAVAAEAWRCPRRPVLCFWSESQVAAPTGTCSPRVPSQHSLTSWQGREFLT